MTILDKDTLAVIMIGTTHSLDMNGKEATIYYETVTRAHMRLPDGTRRSGHWRLVEDGYAVDWENGPSASWKLVHRDGAIDYVDPAGVARATLSRIDFGNPAGLPDR